jgi:integrase
VEAAGADLGHLDLRGPHDLRHTFATWLEDAAIASRVIDELMGHASGRRDRGASGSPMGRIYRDDPVVHRCPQPISGRVESGP